MIYILLSFVLNQDTTYLQLLEVTKKKKKHAILQLLLWQLTRKFHSIDRFLHILCHGTNSSLSFSLVRNRFQQKANNPKPRKIPVPKAIKGYSTSRARPGERPSLVKSELARWLIRRNREESNRRAGPVSRDETNDNVFQPCGPLMKSLR